MCCKSNAQIVGARFCFPRARLPEPKWARCKARPPIHHLLLWEDAKIELRLRAVARRAQFNRRFDQIMDEAERFVRDYNHAIQGIGPASSVYEKNDDRLAKATVPSDVTPVLRLCDGRRSLTDIIDESPFRVFDTVRILTRLVDVGVVGPAEATRRKPPRPPALAEVLGNRPHREL